MAIIGCEQKPIEACVVKPLTNEVIECRDFDSFAEAMKWKDLPELGNQVEITIEGKQP